MKKRVFAVLTAMLMAFGVFAVQVSAATKVAATKITSAKESGGKVTLKWDKISGADGYVIYYTVDGGKAKTLKTVTKKSTVTYTTSKLDKGAYTFYIKGYKTVDGEKVKGEKSNTKKLTIGGSGSSSTEKQSVSKSLVGTTWKFDHVVVDGKKMTLDQYFDYNIEKSGLSPDDPEAVFAKELLSSVFSGFEVKFKSGGKGNGVLWGSASNFTYKVKGKTVTVTNEYGDAGDFILNDKGDELSFTDPSFQGEVVVLKKVK